MSQRQSIENMKNILESYHMLSYHYTYDSFIEKRENKNTKGTLLIIIVV